MSIFQTTERTALSNRAPPKTELFLNCPSQIRQMAPDFCSLPPPPGFCGDEARFLRNFFELLFSDSLQQPLLRSFFEWPTDFHGEGGRMAINERAPLFQGLNGFVRGGFFCPVIAHVAGCHEYHENETDIAVDYIHDIDQTVEG